MCVCVCVRKTPSKCEEGSSHIHCLHVCVYMCVCVCVWEIVYLCVGQKPPTLLGVYVWSECVNIKTFTDTVCMCICTYKHIYMYRCIHRCIYIHIYAYVVRICAYIYNIYARIDIYAYDAWMEYVPTFRFRCIHVCRYIYAALMVCDAIPSHRRAVCRSVLR